MHSRGVLCALVKAASFAVLVCGALGGVRANAQTVVIKNLTDLALGSWSGTANMVGTGNLCVGSSTSGRGYSVRATGSGTGGIFLVSNGTSQLPYTLEYKSNAGFQALAANTTLGGQVGAAVTGCNSGQLNGQIRVTFLLADLSAATSGAYSGTLTLLVTPQ